MIIRAVRIGFRSPPAVAFGQPGANPPSRNLTTTVLFLFQVSAGADGEAGRSAAFAPPAYYLVCMESVMLWYRDDEGEGLYNFLSVRKKWR